MSAMRSRDAAPLTVLSVPRPIPENPYQQLLYAAMRKAGANVLGAPPIPATLSQHRSGPRVLHVHWLWLKQGLMGRYYRYRRAKRLLRTARDLGWKVVWTVHNMKPWDSGVLDLWLRQHLMSTADGFIVHTRATHQALETTKPIKVIPHGHYRDAYPPAQDLSESRQALGLDPGAYTFLAFGQVRAYKGFDRLIRAFRQTDLDAQLLVAGNPFDQAYARTLKEMATGDGRIHLHPRFIPDDQVPRYFGAADRVALPLSESTTSGSLILALSYGRPVLIPDQAELVEVAPPPASILFASAGEFPQKLGVCLDTDPATAREAAIRCADKLNWEPIGKSTVEFFRQLTTD